LVEEFGPAEEEGPGLFPIVVLPESRIHMFCLGRVGGQNRFCLELAEDCPYKADKKVKAPVRADHFYVDVSAESRRGPCALLEPTAAAQVMEDSGLGRAHVKSFHSLPVWVNLLQSVLDAERQWDNRREASGLWDGLAEEPGSVDDDPDALAASYMASYHKNATPSAKRVRFLPQVDEDSMSPDWAYHEAAKSQWADASAVILALKAQVSILSRSLGKPLSAQLAPTAWSAAAELEVRLDQSDASLEALSAQAQVWNRNLQVTESLISSVCKLDSNVKLTYTQASAAQSHATQAHRLASQFDLMGHQDLGACIGALEQQAHSMRDDVAVCAETLVSLQPGASVHSTTAPPLSSMNEVAYYELPIM
jgi:hypothetical protein